MGKSTALKHMALQWADDESEHLNQFDFVFHIALRHVKKDDTIEGLILKQHRLAGMGVHAAEIKAIIDGGMGNMVNELHTVSKHPLRGGWEFQYTNDTFTITRPINRPAWA